MSFKTRALDENGDILLSGGSKSRLITGANAIAQKAECRMRLFLGEWFLNVFEGVPYYRDVLVKNPNIGLITGVFRKVLTNTPGIANVISLTVTLDAKTRKANVIGIARTETGETVKVEPFNDSTPLDPFAITVGGVQVTVGGIPVVATP